MRDRKTFHDRRLSENSVTIVKHLMHQEGNSLSFVDFQRKFPSTGFDFLTHHGLISSIGTYQKKIRATDENTPSKTGFKTIGEIYSVNQF